MLFLQVVVRVVVGMRGWVAVCFSFLHFAFYVMLASTEGSDLTGLWSGKFFDSQEYARRNTRTWLSRQGTPGLPSRPALALIKNSCLDSRSTQSTVSHKGILLPSCSSTFWWKSSACFLVPWVLSKSSGMFQHQLLGDKFLEMASDAHPTLLFT